MIEEGCILTGKNRIMRGRAMLWLGRPHHDRGGHVRIEEGCIMIGEDCTMMGRAMS